MTERPPSPRWPLWGLGLYLVATAAILFLPVSYSSIIEWIGDSIRDATGVTSFGYGWVEFGTNIVLFMPLGFLLTLLFRRAWPGVVLALVLSAGAEIAQMLLPARVTSVRDIVANVSGAAIGAAVAWVVFIRRRRLARPTATRRAR